MYQDLSRKTLIEDDKGKKIKAIEVFSSAISYLKKRLVTDCKKQMTEIEESDMMWVLTVPAIWDDKSKQLMREAAEQVYFFHPFFQFIKIPNFFHKDYKL